MNTLHNDLVEVKQELMYLKEYIEDVKLTEDDLASLERAEEDFKKGKTKRI